MCSDADVEAYASAVDSFGSVWSSLGWKCTVWVHWSVRHSVALLQRWRTLGNLRIHTLHIFYWLNTNHPFFHVRFQVNSLRICWLVLRFSRCSVGDKMHGAFRIQNDI